ncbi:hypothetical protein CCZ01_06535 [Helicobacter monodelphidis]|uniref:TFIIB-type zinc ribbon-containing protein n=1 Tax=Helicobacter sp. 15-1451 TaxID=2004995 RepID=UPI000DCECE35|nr:zf-TFIIB domain-containing protein [Helicobacter sp. 15-1451]RAX57348.1 hypothetical protein CCZ01_06535 [Helicobacter sp. 15-1451]
MLCPVCSNVQLVMSERNGVEIDYCPQCRGVWLDRGELDKIIERSSNIQQRQPERGQYEQPRQQYQEQQYHGGKQNYHKPYKKRESFLSELFDF